MDTNRDYFPSERDETPEVRRAYLLGGSLMDSNNDYFPSERDETFFECVDEPLAQNIRSYHGDAD